MTSNDSGNETERLRDEAALLQPYANLRPEDFGLAFKDAAELRGSPSPSRAKKSRSRRRWLRAAAIGVAAAVAVTVIVTSDSDRSRLPHPPVVEDYRTASQVFQAAADSEAGRFEGIEDANYWRVESSVKIDNNPPFERTIWQGHTTPGVLIQDGTITSVPRADFGLYKRTLRWEDLTTLPTTTSGLLAFLHEEIADFDGRQNWYMLRSIGQLLVETPAPSGLRAALWGVAETLPGIDPPAKAKDSLGRPGWRVSMTQPDRGTLIFIVDTKIGKLLESTFIPRASVSGGKSVTTFVEYGAADTAPDLPAKCRKSPCKFP